jgi:hypothetical protein
LLVSRQVGQWLLRILDKAQGWQHIFSQSSEVVRHSSQILFE